MLDKIMADQKYTATFRKPRTSPAAFEPQSTTFLSPFLHFRALSVRLFYWRAQESVEAYTKRGKKDASGPPESLTGQLLFRDMYFAARAAVGAQFTQTAHNAHCRFIPCTCHLSLDPVDGHRHAGPRGQTTPRPNGGFSDGRMALPASPGSTR